MHSEKTDKPCTTGIHVGSKTTVLWVESRGTDSHMSWVEEAKRKSRVHKMQAAAGHSNSSSPPGPFLNHHHIKCMHIIQIGIWRTPYTMSLVPTQPKLTASLLSSSSPKHMPRLATNDVCKQLSSTGNRPHQLQNGVGGFWSPNSNTSNSFDSYVTQIPTARRLLTLLATSKHILQSVLLHKEAGTIQEGCTCSTETGSPRSDFVE